MLRVVGSVLFWAFLLATSVLSFPVALAIWVVSRPFGPRLVLLHRFTCLWASLYTWFNPAWPVTLEGREHIEPGQAYVMVSNHQSLLDILVLFRLFTHFKWVSKIENFRVPFIGWNMSLNRYIKLRRGDRASVIAMLAACERTLAEPSSVLLFPEGTRSANGRLKAFKPGAFEIAKRTHTPILPILLEGTANALPKHGFVLQGRHPIRVRILEAIEPETFADTSVEDLTARVHAQFAAELEPESQARLSA